MVHPFIASGGDGGGGGGEREGERQGYCICVVLCTSGHNLLYIVNSAMELACVVHILQHKYNNV